MLALCTAPIELQNAKNVLGASLHGFAVHLKFGKVCGGLFEDKTVLLGLCGRPDDQV
jgi:hypothetical protein